MANFLGRYNELGGVRGYRKLFILIALFSFMLNLSPAFALGVGDQAPNFSLSDQDGKTVNLNDFTGKIVVLEWINPDCPFVKRHAKEATMKTLAAEFESKGVIWLGINSTHYLGAKENLAWKSAQGLSYQILDDHQGVVGKLYGAKTTPHMFIIGKDTKVAYQGAIDDDPYGDNGEKRENYVRAALAGLVKSDHAVVSNTNPYGCSVKYKS